jgi:hypothetical protein
MAVLDQIQEYIEQLTTKQFKQFMIIIFSCSFLVSTFIVYRYYRNIHMLKNKIEEINKKRAEVRNILERFEIVKRQKAAVDNLLAKDKGFKILGYFNDKIIPKVGIEANKTREPATSSEELDNGYTEIRLDASFSKMNTQKLTELLDALEQNERIYTKDLEIYKPDQGPTINVNLSIATLEPTIETGETEE